MTIWEKLTTPAEPKLVYKFADDHFIAEFVKTAKNMNISYPKIKEALNKLEASYHARTASDTNTAAS